MVYLKENYTFGVQMLISIESYMFCDFPGGGGGL